MRQNSQIIKVQYVSLSSMCAGRAQNIRSGRRTGTMLQEQFFTLAVDIKKGTPAELRSIHFTLYLSGIEPINSIMLFQCEILICWQIFRLK